MNLTKLNKFWETLHASFWFIPSLMVAIAIGLAFVTVDLDQNLSYDIIKKLALTYSLGPSGSRAILSAIAGSMITVATTAFSITIVALQLASSQFGPRLLRNFMQDTGNQIVLGTFISTFVYSLLVLRTVNGISDNEFVPQIAVTGGIVLAITSVGVLIYFIHHAASSIQVDHVISRVGHDLDGAIDRLFPQKIGQDALENQSGKDDVPEDFDRESSIIRSSNSCYVQAIDEHQLMQIATEHNLLLHLQHRPGQFIVKGDP
ncbi:MAG TPA: DUF2254 domain-containing protein, partial [Leptolyngbya sp.]|nr:DUF2254 domain-containing protein [Leptolyngbya sp.]